MGEPCGVPCPASLEVPTQVRIDDIRVPRIQQGLDLHYRVQGAMPLAVRKLFRPQVGLEDRFEHQHCRHLDYAVLDRWYAQRSLAAVRFRDVRPKQRTRLIRLLFQGFRQFVQPPVLAIRLDIRETYPVHPCDACIGLAVPIGVFEDIAAVQLVVESVEAVAGRRFRFIAQCPLQFPNLFWRC